MQDSTAVDIPESIDQPKNGGLPLFIVDNVWHLFEESLDDQLHAGLISLALREDIIDVIDAPLSSWGDVVDDNTGVTTKAWIPTKYHKYFSEVQRQMQDGGELVRNDFTGLATIKLKYPLGDLKEISFINVPTVAYFSDIAIYTGDHQLMHTLRMISQSTGKTIDLLRQLYIGDYTALRQEFENLAPSPSSV